MTITVETYLDIAGGALPYAELSSLMRTARRSISTKATARDLGWLVCRGYGYDRASVLNPFPGGAMAAAFDSGVIAYEIERDAEFDADDHTGIEDASPTTAPVSMAAAAPSWDIRDRAVNALAVTSAGFFLVALVLSLPI